MHNSGVVASAKQLVTDNRDMIELVVQKISPSNEHIEPMRVILNTALHNAAQIYVENTNQKKNFRNFVLRFMEIEINNWYKKQKLQKKIFSLTI